MILEVNKLVVIKYLGMKNIIKITKLSVIMLLTGVVVLLSACSNDDDGYSGNPEIISVSLAENDSLVVSGLRQNMYIIRGNGFVDVQNIYFNDQNTYFNPTYVTSEVILVTIDAETPFNYSPEKLRVVTRSGEAEYDFDILQPAPTITSFTPKIGGEGTEVTITGAVFDNLESVFFGEAEATIVSYTETEIVVIAPAIDGPTPITVTTEGGATESDDLFGGLLYTIYDDALNSSWWVGGWGVTNDFANTEHVLTGDNAIKVEIAGWSGFQVGNGGAALSINDYGTIQFEIYPQNSGNINIVLNQDWNNGYNVAVVGGQWQTVSVTVTDIGLNGLDVINEIVLQEFNGSGNTYYIDDFGFL